MLKSPTVKAIERDLSTHIEALNRLESGKTGRGRGRGRVVLVIDGLDAIIAATSGEEGGDAGVQEWIGMVGALREV